MDIDIALCLFRVIRISYKTTSSISPALTVVLRILLLYQCHIARKFGDNAVDDAMCHGDAQTLFSHSLYHAAASRVSHLDTRRFFFFPSSSVEKLRESVKMPSALVVGATGVIILDHPTHHISSTS